MKAATKFFLGFLFHLIYVSGMIVGGILGIILIVAGIILLA